MGKAAAARRLATAAAYGGGGLSVLGAGLYGVLVGQAKWARRTIGVLDETPPNATGWYGRGRPGPTLRVALLGDSSAAGYGVDMVEQTPGALLASGLAEAANRRVLLRELAVVGGMSSDLDSQIDRALPGGPQLAIILIGANDVTHRMLPSDSVRYLAEGVLRLRRAGVEVLVGTCPDLGTIKPIQPPLRQVARSWSRRLAAAQTIAVVEAGGRSVSLGSILGPEFAARSGQLFGPDRFHPSAEGYRSMVAVMLPSVLASLGLAPDEEARPDVLRGEGVLPVAYAAVEAVRTPGTELEGMQLAGVGPEGEGRPGRLPESSEAGAPAIGRRGRWVELRHRRRRQRAEADEPVREEQLV